MKLGLSDFHLSDDSVLITGSRLNRSFVIPWDACGTPTVKIRFGCTQNCKASQ